MMTAFSGKILLVLACLGTGQAKVEQDNLVWTNIRDLELEGKGFTETKAYFDRLPAKAEKIVRSQVWGLSRDSTGMCVRFVTDASAISGRWTLTTNRLGMPHMPPTGVSGLDLYVRMPDSKWAWLGVGQPTKVPTNTAVLAQGIPAGKREYLLYLPLYNGVSSVEIGIPKGATLVKAPAYPAGHEKPILFYGTSITQGGCASRPGMVHTAIIGRKLNRPVINLGFSGNGMMEKELAELFTELDPGVFVLDCLPNIVASVVSERTEPFVHILRKKHPKTPIVLVEDRSYSNSVLLSSSKKRNDDSRAALKAAYERLTKAGVGNLYYIPGADLLGDDNEGTVDSSHPTDLGFMRQAEAFLKVLGPIVNK